MWLWMSIAAASVDTLDAALTDLEERGLLIGEVVVAESGTITYQRALGGVPEGARYRIGSISKSFTAAAVLALVQDSLFALDDPLHVHLTELRPLAFEGTPVQLGHLLSHTSGLGPGLVGPWAREPSFDEYYSALQATDQSQPTRPPGEAFAYSNGGYKLLTELVRRRVGTPFEAYLKFRFWRPLGMEDTAIQPSPGALAREIPGHVWCGPLGWVDSERALPHLLANDMRWDLGGDGAISSTTADLVRWAEGLRTHEVLSRRAVEILTTPVLDNYGAGWVIDDVGVWHNGALSPLGAYAYLRWSPHSGQTVVGLFATDVSALQPELRTVIEAALAGDPVPEVTAKAGLMGGLAALSSLWLPWWLGAAPLLAAIGWARRRRPRRRLVWGAALSATGAALFPLAFTGVPGIAAALLGGVALATWGRGTAPGGSMVPIVLGGLVLQAGVVWSGLVQALYALIRSPWWLFTTQ